MDVEQLIQWLARRQKTYSGTVIGNEFETAIEGGGVRILYRRTWRRPDGGEFGKARVRMTTPSAFSAWRTGRNSGLWRELEDYRDQHELSETRHVP
jgi:hypothetical protein